jgi:hypothetical protein
MWKERGELIIKARNTKTICPYCFCSGSAVNLKRYHFDNCLKAPVLSDNAKNRILGKEIVKQRASQKAKEKRDIGQKDMVCEWCGEKYKNSNFFKYHGDRCKHNPNYKQEIFKCKYCGLESTNKTNIVRFHNENCKHK